MDFNFAYKKCKSVLKFRTKIIITRVYILTNNYEPLYSDNVYYMPGKIEN